MTEGPDPALVTRRKFAERRRELIRKIQEYARADDERGFIDRVLIPFDIWEGMPQYEQAMAIFREIRDREQSSRRR
jgi:hypothetical protein